MIVFGDTLRRLDTFRGMRAALKRHGFEENVRLIANCTTEQCLQALETPLERWRGAGAEALAADMQLPKDSLVKSCVLL